MSSTTQTPGAGEAERLIQRLENAAVGGLFHCEADREEAVEIAEEEISAALAAQAPKQGGAGAVERRIKEGIYGGYATGSTTEMLRAIASDPDIKFPLPGGMDRKHLRERAAYLDSAIHAACELTAPNPPAGEAVAPTPQTDDLAGLSAGARPNSEAPQDGTRILARGRHPTTGSETVEVRETYWSFYGKWSIAYARYKAGEGPSGRWEWKEPFNKWSLSWDPTEWWPMSVLQAPAAPQATEKPVAWVWEMGVEGRWTPFVAFEKPSNAEFRRNIEPLFKRAAPAASRIGVTEEEIAPQAVVGWAYEFRGEHHLNKNKPQPHPLVRNVRALGYLDVSPAEHDAIDGGDDGPA